MPPDPDALAEQVIELSQQRRPPINLCALLRPWPELFVVFEKLDGDGFFVDLGSAGGQILINKQTELKRQRFTLAHEFGHFLLQNHLKQRLTGKGMGSQREVWCNNFASSILMPREMMLKYIRQGRLSGLTERILS